jgi:hypothetical protein
MRFTRLLARSLVLTLLLSTASIYAQTPLLETAAHLAIRKPAESAVQRPVLSPGALEAAKVFGIADLVDQLYRLSETTRQQPQSTPSLEALMLRQEITEAVVTASLEVDGLLAEIDSESAQISAIRAELESRRDRAINLNTIANIVAGAVSGVAGTALQFKSNTANTGNAIGVAGAGISTVLSFIGLRQQRGGKRALGVAPNLLAKVLDRKPEFHSDYPEDIWNYLNSVPPAEQGSETRRARLLKRWTELGRLENASSPKAQHKIDLLTSSVSEQRALSIDVLVDRGAMLADVRAQVSLINRDLSKLMLAVKSMRREKQ